MNLLKALNQKNYQTYNRKVAHELKSVAAAIVLQELIDRYSYHTEHSEQEPLDYKGVEWWYETIETMENRTALTRKNQDAAIKILEDAGLIIKIQKGCPPKRYFYLHQQHIMKLYSGDSYPKGKLNIELLNCPNGTNQDDPLGQLEMTERDKLESPQVVLGENEPLHNMNLSNEPKKQQTETAAVFACLLPLSISQEEKEWITRNHTEAHVEHAVKYATDPSTEIKKSFIQCLKWACRNQPAIKKTAAATEAENKQYLDSLRHLDMRTFKDYRIDIGINDISFIHTKSANHAIIYTLQDTDFKKKVHEQAKKLGFI